MLVSADKVLLNFSHTHSFACCLQQLLGSSPSVAFLEIPTASCPGVISADQLPAHRHVVSACDYARENNLERKDLF